MAINAPIVSINIDYSDVQFVYTPSFEVRVDVNVTSGGGGVAPITFEYDTSSAQTGYYGPGSYTVKVRAKDSTGAYSSWTTSNFNIATPETTGTITSTTLGDKAITSSNVVDLNLQINCAGEYSFKYVDFYIDPDTKIKVAHVPHTTIHNDISGYFERGRHLIVAQVKDVFGGVKYISRFFAVGESVGGDEAEWSGMTTIVEEPGVYDGDKPLAYINAFIFNTPVVSGHSSGNGDYVIITGIKEDGSEVQIIRFSSDNGQANASSNGTWSSSSGSGTFSYPLNTFTKLRFSYTMAAGHEGCLAKATGGLYYEVEFAFIESSEEDLERIFLEKIPNARVLIGA